MISYQSFASTTQDKTALIDELVTKLKDHYVLVEQLDVINNGLKDLAKSDAYNKAQSNAEIAKLITKRLQTFDKHFGLTLRASSEVHKNNKPSENWFEQLSRKNYGFEQVKVLKGNIGYIDFWGFALLNDQSRQKVKHIMGYLDGIDALIIDLRKNGGGSAEMVQLISSYFLSNKTHLNSFYSRATNKITEYWTFDNIVSPFTDDLPIYILTSDYTFSAAEEFAYNFKQLKRATLIGESTKGGANPWGFVNVNKTFKAAIPNAKAINPITKTNWEGVGVQPDIAISNQAAFDKTYLIALEQLFTSIKNPYQKTEITKQIIEQKAKLKNKG